MRILVVEDEAPMRKALQKGLSKLGYTVDVSADGEEALELYFGQIYEAVILDLNLPKLNGLEVLQEIRKDDSTIKVLILSARNEVEDRVSGLDQGANDYLCKPFAFQELVARLRALLRRDFTQTSERFEIGGVLVDTALREVTLHGHRVSLSRKEYGILEYLLRNRGRTIRTENLIEQVWEKDNDGVFNSFKVHINSLRKKLPDISIVNVRGEGYYVE